MTRRRLPSHGDCFLCGTTTHRGVGLALYAHEGGVEGEVTFQITEQGAPGFVHGGALAAIMDESMTAAAWLAGHKVMAANLNVEYRHPVRVGSTVQVKARVVEHMGRRVEASSDVRLADGTVACSARGTFANVSSRFAGNPEIERLSNSMGAAEDSQSERSSDD